MSFAERKRELFDRCWGIPKHEWDAELAGEAEDLRNAVIAQLEQSPRPEELEEEEETAPPQALRTGEIWGRFEVGASIDEGGMGLVYRARVAETESTKPRPWDLAIKFVKPGQADLAHYQSLFDRETSALAQLVHEGIARFVDCGVDHGEPYMVMELVDGRSVVTDCEERHLTVKQIVQLFLSVCDAVHFAHLRGIQHRDLHPGNILVTSAGQVKVIDFGLAKLATKRADLTTQARNFAYPYASPEYVDLEPTGVQSDVYCLAAVLYRLLTGQPIFGDPGTVFYERRLQMIRSTDPLPASTVAPREWSSELKQDLDCILARGLAKKAEDRYPTVQEFRNDLERFLQGEPVTAVPESLLYWGRKYLFKHRAACTALALATLFGLWRGHIAASSFRDSHLQLDAGNEWAEITKQLLVNQPLVHLAEARLAQAGSLASPIEAQRQFVAQVDALPQVHAAVVIGELAEGWLQLARLDRSQGQPALCISSANKSLARVADADRLIPQERLRWRTLRAAAIEIHSGCQQEPAP